MSLQRNIATGYDFFNGLLGEPEEFASVVAFFCSERSSYVTGTCLQIDGGAVKGVF